MFKSILKPLYNADKSTTVLAVTEEDISGAKILQVLVQKIPTKDVEVKQEKSGGTNDNQKEIIPDEGKKDKCETLKKYGLRQKEYIPVTERFSAANENDLEDSEADEDVLGGDDNDSTDMDYQVFEVVQAEAEVEEGDGVGVDGENAQIEGEETTENETVIETQAEKKRKEPNEDDENSLKCDYCSYTTPNKGLMARHATGHANLKCEVCSFTSTLHRRFREHMKKTKHANPNYKSNEANEKEIEKVEKTTTAQIKQKLQKSSDDDKDDDKLAVYKQSKRKKAEETFAKAKKCEQCPFETIVKESWVEHGLLHSLLNDGLEIYDEEENKNKAALKFLQDNESLMCLICKRFTTKYNKSMSQHIKGHMANKQECATYVMCDQCNFSCHSNTVMENHMKRIHNEGSIHGNEKKLSNAELKKYHITVDSGSRSAFKCDFCSYTTVNPGHFKRHMLSHDVLTCPHCAYETTLKRKFKMHTARHTRPFRCDKCDYRASNTRDLKQHKMIHEGNNPVKCEICKYECKTKHQMTQHKRKHSGEFLKCDAEGCDFKTPYKWALSSHKNKHCDDKNYLCGECGYQTNDRYCFLKHSSCHFETKDIQCPTCEYKARFKAQLNRHIQTVHQKVKSYACDKCEFTTGYRESILHHIYAHRGVKPFRCGLCMFRSADKHKVRRHALRSHQGEELTIIEETYNTVDPGNYKITPDPDNLQVELVTPDEAIGAYRCSDCKTVCRTQRALRHHCMMFHDLGSLSVITLSTENPEGNAVGSRGVPEQTWEAVPQVEVEEQVTSDEMTVSQMTTVPASNADLDQNKVIYVTRGLNDSEFTITIRNNSDTTTEVVSDAT